MSRVCSSTIRMQLLQLPLSSHCPLLFARHYLAPQSEILSGSQAIQVHRQRKSAVWLGPCRKLRSTLLGESSRGWKGLSTPAWREDHTLNKVVGMQESAKFCRHEQGTNMGRQHPQQHLRAVAQGISVGDSVLSSTETSTIAAIESALGVRLGQGPMTPAPKPLVIIISGPSGVGKDAVIKKLQEERQELHFVVTATSRPQRPGEVHGVDYLFVSREDFERMIDAEELLEHAVVYGDFKGIPKQQVRDGLSSGRDVVLRLDVQGAATLRSILGNEAVFIFLVAESEVALVRRLVERKTESMDKILVRVGTARKETMRLDEFDYVVVNKEGEIDRTVGAIVSIIDAEKARVVPKSPKL